MQFDLFYEISQPPSLRRSESQAFADTLAEIKLADQLGYGCAWLVEHHFMPSYSHSAAPDLILAAASQHTDRIRLGLAVTPLPYHHPLQVIERCATLDILSHGRLELGIGRGFSPQEYQAFGVDMAQSRSITQEALTILRQGLSQPSVHFQGQHYHLNNLPVVPHPIQQPHPPLWTAAVSPDSFLWAAREQLGVLAGPFKPWMMVRQDIRHYRDAWQSPVAPRTGMTLGLFCLPDGKRARALAKPALEWFYHQLLSTTLPVLEQLYPSYEHFHDLGRFRHLIKLGINLKLLETFGMAVVGSPAECIDKLQAYREAGITNLLCAVGAGALDSAAIQESLHCIASDVMPFLTD